MGDESFIRRHLFGLFVLFVVIGLVVLWQLSEAKPDSYATSALDFILATIIMPVHNFVTSVSIFLPYGVGAIICLLCVVGFMRRSGIKQKASSTVHKTADKIKPAPLSPVTPTKIDNPGAVIQETSDTAKEAISATKKSSEDLKKELEQVASA